MYWEENQSADRFVVPDDILDAVYGITCRMLPVDHAYALSQAIQQALPWFADETGTGLHTIHGADSGNGWMRPEEPDAMLQLSRRTKLALRLPKTRLTDAEALIGQTLNVADQPLRIDKLTVRPLSPITTLFSRHVVTVAGEDENGFLQTASEQMAALGIRPKKMLCGKKTPIATPAGTVHTRSLLVADIAVEESVLLQQHGLGPERLLGCGLFIPHKDINEVRPKSE